MKAKKINNEGICIDNPILHDQYGRIKRGAGNRNRTCDLRVTSALLYQLSYTGIVVGYCGALR